MQNINLTYATLLGEVLDNGEEVVTRNSKVITECGLSNTVFTSFPLVTVRKTAWRKAISEMAWFLSGSSLCPEDLRDWWGGQLSSDGWLVGGYARQFRYSGSGRHFDQVKFIHEGLRNNSNSRRLLMTVWNPEDMANITTWNDNPNTPTCCHSIVVQFFVRSGKLHMKTYQRSADMLLGVPHNWVQSWAMLLYFAYHARLQPGVMTWMWGDAHIYCEASHLEAAEAIIAAAGYGCHEVRLVYAPETVEYDENNVPVFKAADFYIEGEIPAPKVAIRPKLL